MAHPVADRSLACIQIVVGREEKGTTRAGLGVIFAKEVHDIQNRLIHGDGEAVSKWMEHERVRVFGDCPILQFPESWRK